MVQQPPHRLLPRLARWALRLPLLPPRPQLGPRIGTVAAGRRVADDSRPFPRGVGKAHAHGDKSTEYSNFSMTKRVAPKTQPELSELYSPLNYM